MSPKILQKLSECCISVDFAVGMPESCHVLIKPGVAIMGVACACSFVELVPLNGGQCYSRADNLSCDFLESAGSLTRLSKISLIVL